MIRTFIGVRIAPETVRKISQAMTQLKTRLRGVRWVGENNLHFTLKFLGEIEESQSVPIGQALRQAIGPFPPFTINAKGLGVFPGLKRPRVLWVGLEGKQLAVLAVEVQKALEPLSFAPDTRAFKPHLTIGRWRSFEGSSEQLGQEILRWRGHEFGKARVDEVVFFQSILKKEGAVYQPLEIVTLAGHSPASDGES